MSWLRNRSSVQQSLKLCPLSLYSRQRITPSQKQRISTLEYCPSNMSVIPMRKMTMTMITVRQSQTFSIILKLEHVSSYLWKTTRVQPATQYLPQKQTNPKKWIRGMEAEYMNMIVKTIMSKEYIYPQRQMSLVPYLLWCRNCVFFSQVRLTSITQGIISPALKSAEKMVKASSFTMQMQQKKPSGCLQMSPKSSMKPHPVRRISMRLSVSLTRDPPMTLSAKKMSSTLISFIWSSY